MSMCNEGIGSHTERETIESVIEKLNNQADLMKKKIEQFEFFPV